MRASSNARKSMHFNAKWKEEKSGTLGKVLEEKKHVFTST